MAVTTTTVPDGASASSSEYSSLLKPPVAAGGKSNLSRNASSASHISEARQHLLRAERSTKPSLLRWKPKLSSAGDEYCKAAIMFYQAGEVEASKTNLLKACECFKKKRAWYSAAKTLEQAMAITHKQVREVKTHSTEK